jgi:hypothetical protein
MKKLATLVFGFLLIGITSNATTNNSELSEYNKYNPYDGRAYIFEEGGVEFSVFADGQFDFSYVGQYNSQQVQVSVGSPNVNISFNAGHDYELYVQYDDYGAVTQIENVTIYYDNYGRIAQAGNVDIRYNNRRIVRVGGLFINYNYYGHYASSTGFINTYNQFYVYRPWHAYYVAPFYSSCIVYDYPYRRYYSPIRYSYAHHSNYYNNRNRVAYQNGRRDFNRPGSRLHYRNGRTERNNNYNANRRNTMISESGRGENTVKGRPVASNGKVDRNRPGSVTEGRPTSNNGKVDRTRPSSITKRRPSSSNGSVDRSRQSSITRGKPASNSAKADRSRPSSSAKGKPVTTRPVASKRTTSNTYKSQNRTAKSSSSSKLNKSKNLGGNVNSRDTSSKRGRGL